MRQQMSTITERPAGSQRESLNAPSIDESTASPDRQPANPCYRGHNLIFIVGSPRSGTTWLQRLLASHPQVRTGQESHVFDYIGPQILTWRKQLETAQEGRRPVGLPAYFHEDEFRLALHEHMMRLLAPMLDDLAPDEIFIEKTPSHALHVHEIIELLPESRIIHVVRDARDVAASSLAASRSWGSRWAPSNGRRAARQWVRHVSAARSIAELAPATQFHEVRYEDLHQAPVTTLQHAFAFLGLALDEHEIADVIAENAADSTRAGGGTHIPLRGEFQAVSQVVTEPGGFVRKGQTGSWVDDLTRLEKLYVWLIARRLMNELGYSWRVPW
jgi:hypothetical protein